MIGYSASWIKDKHVFVATGGGSQSKSQSITDLKKSLSSPRRKKTPILNENND